MSMISAQINELRKWADQLSERENEFGVVVRALVAALRNAADTIWELRDDLQRANAAVQDAEHDESMAWDRVRKAEAENAKLRELCRELWPFVKAGWVHACPNRECCLFEECDADSEYECLIEEHMAGRMRELGIEVDG